MPESCSGMVVWQGLSLHGAFCRQVWQRHTVLLHVTGGEHIPLQSLAIVQITDQGFFRPCRAPITPFVMPPEHQHIDRPCIITMLGHTLAYAGWQGIKGIPVIPIIPSPDFVPECAFVCAGWQQAHCASASVRHTGNGSGR